MALTNLELTVDQKRAGWLARAADEAARHLAGSQRPALCAELRRAFGHRPSLETLARFLRLAVLPGEAPPGYAPTVAIGSTGGRPDASRSSDGRVPALPVLRKIDALPEAEKNLWMLGAGEFLLCGSYFDREKGRLPTTSNVRCLSLGQGDLWQPAWDFCGPGFWRPVASDGTYLASVSFDAPNFVSIRTLEIATAKLLWSHPSPLKAAAVKVLVTGGMVVVLDSDNDDLTAYHAATGAFAWGLAMPADPDFLVFTHLLALGSRLLLCGRERVMSVEVATGAIVWNEPVERWDGHLLWSGGGQLGLYCGDDTLVRYDLANGSRLPAAPRLCGAHKGAKRLRDGHLATAGEQAVINARGELSAYRLDGQNEELWSVRLDPSLELARTAIVDETVLMLTAEKVCGFSLHDGHPTGLELELGFAPHAVWGHPRGILMTGGGHAAFIGEQASGAP